MKIGEVMLRALRPFKGLNVSTQLDEIARDKARREAKVAQHLDEKPGRIAAGPRPKFKGLLRGLNTRLHADHVADRLVQGGVEIHEIADSVDRTFGQARDVSGKARAGRFRLEVRRKLRLQLGLVSKRKLLGVGLDEEVERVDDGKFGGEIGLDLEFRHLDRKS